MLVIERAAVAWIFLQALLKAVIPCEEIYENGNKTVRR